VTGVDLKVTSEAFSLVMSALRGLVGDQVDLDADYYWAVDPAEALHPYEQPKSLGIGQLSDCMAELRSIADDPQKALTYHLVWLGDVLRALGASAGAEIAERDA
jgi:hypothetical protein